MKVVINACHGGFGLSHEAVMRYCELTGRQVWPEKSTVPSLVPYTYWLVPPEKRLAEISREDWRALTQEQRTAYVQESSTHQLYDRYIPRDDPALVQVVEELGIKASDRFAKLVVVEIPDGVSWEIAEFDGYEHVAEAHRTWG